MARRAPSLRSRLGGGHAGHVRVAPARRWLHEDGALDRPGCAAAPRDHPGYGRALFQHGERSVDQREHLGDLHAANVGDQRGQRRAEAPVARDIDAASRARVDREPARLGHLTELMQRIARVAHGGRHGELHQLERLPDRIHVAHRHERRVARRDDDVQPSRLVDRGANELERLESGDGDEVRRQHPLAAPAGPRVGIEEHAGERRVDEEGLVRDEERVAVACGEEGLEAAVGVQVRRAARRRGPARDAGDALRRCERGVVHRDVHRGRACAGARDHDLGGAHCVAHEEARERDDLDDAGVAARTGHRHVAEDRQAARDPIGLGDRSDWAPLSDREGHVLLVDARAGPVRDAAIEDHAHLRHRLVAFRARAQDVVAVLAHPQRARHRGLGRSRDAQAQALDAGHRTRRRRTLGRVPEPLVVGRERSVGQREAHLDLEGGAHGQVHEAIGVDVEHRGRQRRTPTALLARAGRERDRRHHHDRDEGS